MKRISDYKDESAIELWADLLEPLGAIFADEKVIEVMNGKQSVMKIVSTIFKTHKEEAKEFLLAVDDTPLDGSNVFTRFFVTFLDILNNKDFLDFFKNAEQTKTDVISFGSVMESTGENEN